MAKQLLLICILFALFYVYSCTESKPQISSSKKENAMKLMDSVIKRFDNEIQEFINSAEKEFKNEIPHMHPMIDRHFHHKGKHGEGKHGEHHKGHHEGKPGHHGRPGEHHGHHEGKPGHHGRPGEHHGHHNGQHKNGPHKMDHQFNHNHHHRPLFDDEKSVLWYHQRGNFFTPTIVQNPSIKYAYRFCIPLSAIPRGEFYLFTAFRFQKGDSTISVRFDVNDQYITKKARRYGGIRLKLHAKDQDLNGWNKRDLDDYSISGIITSTNTELITVGFAFASKLFVANPNPSLSCKDIIPSNNNNNNVNVVNSINLGSQGHSGSSSSGAHSGGISGYSSSASGSRIPSGYSSGTSASGLSSFFTSSNLAGFIMMNVFNNLVMILIIVFLILIFVLIVSLIIFRLKRSRISSNDDSTPLNDVSSSVEDPSINSSTLLSSPPQIIDSNSSSQPNLSLNTNMPIYYVYPYPQQASSQIPQQTIPNVYFNQSFGVPNVFPQQSQFNFAHTNMIGRDLGLNLTDDIELLGFGNADSEERLSDISDGDLSMGATDTDGSICSAVEFTLFPEVSKPPDKPEKVEKASKSEKSDNIGKSIAPSLPSKLPKLSQKVLQTKPTARLSLSRSTSKIPSSSKKITAATTSNSSIKPPKRRP